MARVFYPDGQPIGEVTDPALLAYYRSVEYVIEEGDAEPAPEAEPEPEPAEVIVPPSSGGSPPPEPPDQAGK